MDESRGEGDGRGEGRGGLGVEGRLWGKRGKKAFFNFDF